MSSGNESIPTVATGRAATAGTAVATRCSDQRNGYGGVVERDSRGVVRGNAVSPAFGNPMAAFDTGASDSAVAPIAAVPACTGHGCDDSRASQ